MTRYLHFFVLLLMFVRVSTLAEAACTISPATPTGIVAGKQTLVTVTNDGSCTGYTIGIYDIREGPMLPSEVYRICGYDTAGNCITQTTNPFTFVYPASSTSWVHFSIKPPGVSSAVVKSGAFIVAANAENIYCGSGNAACDPNLAQKLTSGVPLAVTWRMPTTIHPNTVVTLANTNAPASLYDVQGIVPEGATLGTIALTPTALGYPKEWRLIRGGTIEFRGPPMTIVAGSASPPPTILCTVKLLSGSPTGGSVITGTVVSCP